MRAIRLSLERLNELRDKLITETIRRHGHKYKLWICSRCGDVSLHSKDCPCEDWEEGCWEVG